jgi:thioredoxin-like negative regulator of GroEL
LVALKQNSEREGRALAQKFGVQNLPTVVFIDASGQEVSRIGGYMPAEPFVEKARGIIQLYRSLPGLEAKVAKNPGDSKSALSLLEFYAGQSRREKAAALLAKIQRADPSNARGHLLPALISLGEADTTAQAWSVARPRFAKALTLAKKPDERAFSLLQLGICDASQGKLDSAVAQWKKVLAVPGCPARFQQGAQQFIERARRMKQQ